jgi:hypothetical protein
MNYNVSIWLVALGLLLFFLPGLNVLAAAALGIGAGNALGRLGANDNGYKELR